MNEDSPYYDLAVEMERMKTPWFLGQEIYYEYKNSIIETIKLNWLFDSEGEILPLTTYYKENKIERYSFGKKEIPCTIE
jgi:hypothetical protein